ncbi:unnamed protein product [Boreogadus saida]
MEVMMVYTGTDSWGKGKDGSTGFKVPDKKQLDTYLSTVRDFGNNIFKVGSASDTKGQRYGKVYNKKSRKWSLYTLKQEKDYSYIKDLQSEILQKKLSGGGVPRRRTLRPTDPRQYGVLPGIPAPTTQELLQTQLSKGLGHSLPKV